MSDMASGVLGLYKNNIVGGPTIVFHRYHERDVTTIRPTDYEEPKTCKKIIGYDANVLYLWSIMQEMPTGHFVRRKSGRSWNMYFRVRPGTLIPSLKMSTFWFW
jgi:hypothetical protein